MCLPAASIPVVGFNAILMSEHFGAFLTFGVLHGALAIRYVKVGSSHQFCCVLRCCHSFDVGIDCLLALPGQYTSRLTPPARKLQLVLLDDFDDNVRRE